MHSPENLAPQGLLEALVHAGIELRHPPAQFVIRYAGCRCESAQTAIAFTDDAVPPALGPGKQPPGGRFVRAEAGNGRPDRLGIHIPHQLADQLLLTPECAARSDSCGPEYRIAEVLLERQRSQRLGVQGDQGFAKLLQFELLAFALAFAGL